VGSNPTRRTLFTLRGSSAVEQQNHNLRVVGSNPTHATKSPYLSWLEDQSHKLCCPWFESRRAHYPTLNNSSSHQMGVCFPA
jgi:hypothetical protein